MPRQLDIIGVVDLCDNVHLRRDETNLYDVAFDSEVLVPLYLSESPDSAVIGLLRPLLIEQLKKENDRSKENGLSELWSLRLDPSTYIKLRNGTKGPSVSFRNWVDTPTKRTAAMKELCERWRDTGLFSDVCGPKQWRDELYPIYSDPFGVHDHPRTAGRKDELNFAFEIERSAAALFGVVTYSANLNIYDEVFGEGSERALRVWVPTRAHTKPTFPGLLDNTVAGGIPSGMPIFECLVKECIEEANLDPDIIRKYARAVGSVSYFSRAASGWLQPEVEYTFDIVIPSGADLSRFTPSPLDDEVESFEFVSHDRLLEKLKQGLFKPNCGLVIIDLLIRLGYITPDNEPNFAKIINRLHGNFDYMLW
ncbi:nudix hydrolase 20 [Agrocybe pediades]|nr:nudix hydrolase 20 [Agrocybe pediades]